MHHKPIITRLESRCQPGFQVPVPSVGKDTLPSSFTGLLAEFSSSKVVDLRVSVPCWLLARGHPQFLAT